MFVVNRRFITRMMSPLVRGYESYCQEFFKISHRWFHPSCLYKVVFTVERQTVAHHGTEEQERPGRWSGEEDEDARGG